MYSELIKLYRQFTGHQPVEIFPIFGSGSDRRYYRLKGPVNLIGVIGTNCRENAAFIYESKFYRERALRVPAVLAFSVDGLSYLQEDLGTESLWDIIQREGESARVIGLCEEALSELVKMQTTTDGFEWEKCYPVSEVDKRSVLWDLNYFKYCFLKPMGVELNEPLLEDEFELLVNSVIEAQPRGFMIRDFQSRNIMIHEGLPWFIDFQGGRKGPLVYDAISFIWQARAGFSKELKNRLLDHYINQLTAEETVVKDIDKLIVYRMLQVLGAYGFRGLIEKKPMFMGYIPQVLSICREYLDKSLFPEIANCLLSASDNIKSTTESESEGLTVYVSSFSYKVGLPDDSSGNGGGFVFDCRAIHNPGRYEPYKSLTGEDKPVIEFLETKTDIAEFLGHCYSLVDASIEVYLRRGFTSLQVNFGCTGGRHRSVYSAEHMARHINQKYGVRVILTHREQHKSIQYPATR